LRKVRLFAEDPGNCFIILHPNYINDTNFPGKFTTEFIPQDDIKDSQIDIIDANSLRTIPLCNGLRITLGTVEKYVKKKGTNGRLNISGFNKMLSGQDKPIMETVLSGPYKGNIQTFSYLCWKASNTYGKEAPWRFEGNDWEDTAGSFIVLNNENNILETSSKRTNMIELPHSKRRKINNVCIPLLEDSFKNKQEAICQP